MKRNVIISFFVLVIIFTWLQSTDVCAASNEKYSIYTITNELKEFYPSAKIKKDNRGYYFTYQNNGYFECYLGKSKKMTIQDFSEKIGGGTQTTVVKQTITEKGNKLKSLAVGALVSYFTKDVSWLRGFVIGTVADSAVGKILRKPGKYRYTTEVCKFPIRNGALKNCTYERTFYLTTHRKIEKYNKSKKKYEVLFNDKTPQYSIMR